jgi:CsbD-like
MDKDRIAGAAKEIKGSVKEAIGKVVGDAKLQSDGKAEGTAGKVPECRWRHEGYRAGDRQGVNRAVLREAPSSRRSSPNMITRQTSVAQVPRPA